MEKLKKPVCTVDEYDEFDFDFNNKKYDKRVCGEKTLKGYIHGTCIS